MSNKRKLPKKQRGIRYVAKVLKKYGGKKYKNYQARLEKSRDVLAQIKQSGQKATVSSVMNLTRVHRTKPGQEQAPFIDYRLLKQSPYYALIDYPTLIHLSSDKITFRSELFNPDVEEVKGQQRPTYEKTFSGFVNFGNRETPKNTSSDDIAIFVRCTPPEKIKGQWISNIISVAPNDEPYDFGYTPTEPTLPKTGVPPKEPIPTPKEPQAPTTPTKTDQQRILELELENKKADLYQKAMDLLLQSKISKAEYKQMLQTINNLK